MKLKYCLIFVMFLLINSNARADEYISIFLSNSDNSPVRVNLSEISSLKFNKTVLFVGDNDGLFKEYNFSDIRKITFEGGTTSIETIDAATTKANVYPNPAKNMLFIEASDDMHDSDVYIYSMTGVLMTQCEQWNGEMIDISNLNAGVYFVKINSLTLKFVKQ